MPPVLFAITTLSVVLLAGVTILWQEYNLGLANIEGEQLARHLNVLAGRAPNPWRYRVLSEWVAAAFIAVARTLPVSRPVAWAFLSFRFLQNALILSFACSYYRRLGMDARRALLGVMLLAYAFTFANFNSDLSANTYFDVMFYIMAAMSVLSGGPRWPFLTIAAVAALNRETSGLIPLLPLSEWLVHPRAIPHNWRRRTWFAISALGTWLAIFVGLRMWLGQPSQTWQTQWGYAQGLPTMLMNLSSHITLMYLAVTFSILPLLVLWEFSALPDFIRGLFWLMVPGWLVLHLSLVVANETRIFLVPIALVLIPGALYWRAESTDL